MVYRVQRGILVNTLIANHKKYQFYFSKNHHISGIKILVLTYLYGLAHIQSLHKCISG